MPPSAAPRGARTREAEWGRLDSNQRRTDYEKARGFSAGLGRAGIGSATPFRPRPSGRDLARSRLVSSRLIPTLGEHVDEPDVLRQEMHVRRERERGGVVAEPQLHLLRVQPTAEQDRPAHMAQRVEAGPLDAGRLASRAEHVAVQVPHVEMAAGRARPHEVSIRGTFRGLPARPQVSGERRSQRHAATAVRALGRADAAVPHSTPDVDTVPAEVDVAPGERDHPPRSEGRSGRAPAGTGATRRPRRRPGARARPRSAPSPARCRGRRSGRRHGRRQRGSGGSARPRRRSPGTPSPARARDVPYSGRRREQRRAGSVRGRQPR